jgi:hypothetical protein
MKSMKHSILLLLPIIAYTWADCTKELQCCAPGSLQYGDPPEFEDAGGGSFCTHKPFEDGYVMNIGQKVPIQVNLVDYCTDKILYSTFFAVEMDKFSLVNIPCTYQPVACSLLPTEQVAACQAGQKIWTDVFGCSKTNTSTASTQNKTFYQQEIGGRICSAENYCEYSAKTGDNAEKGCTKRSDLLWNRAPVLDVGSPHEKSVPYCSCNWKHLEDRANGTNVTTGVPDGFIKDGTSTFYVQESRPRPSRRRSLSLSAPPWRSALPLAAPMEELTPPPPPPRAAKCAPAPRALQH